AKGWAWIIVRRYRFGKAFSRKSRPPNSGTTYRLPFPVHRLVDRFSFKLRVFAARRHLHLRKLGVNCLFTMVAASVGGEAMQLFKRVLALSVLIVTFSGSVLL